MEPLTILAIGLLALLSITGAGILYWRWVRSGGRLTPMERAYVAYDDGRKYRAGALVNRILRKTPGNETALYLRVLIDVEDGDPADLAERVRPFLPGMKRPAATALVLAQAFLERGDERSAQFWFDIA